jgi:serine/threonine protein kinase
VRAAASAWPSALARRCAFRRGRAARAAARVMGLCGSRVGPLSSHATSKKDFHVETVIGQGGFGKVNAVVKTVGYDRGTWYAMKTLAKRVILERNHVGMVMKERNLLARLHCPQLVNVHYAFQDDRHLYIVMDVFNLVLICLLFSKNLRFLKTVYKKFVMQWMQLKLKLSLFLKSKMGLQVVKFFFLKLFQSMCLRDLETDYHQFLNH